MICVSQLYFWQQKSELLTKMTGRNSATSWNTWGKKCVAPSFGGWEQWAINVVFQRFVCGASKYVWPHRQRLDNGERISHYSFNKTKAEYKELSQKWVGWRRWHDADHHLDLLFPFITGIWDYWDPTVASQPELHTPGTKREGLKQKAHKEYQHPVLFIAEGEHEGNQPPLVSYQGDGRWLLD